VPHPADQAVASCIVECWKDPVFRATFLADPVSCLKAKGWSPPPGITFRVVESTETNQYIVIPPKPADPVHIKPGVIALGSSGNNCG
jgi:hypothetical protein